MAECIDYSLFKDRFLLTVEETANAVGLSRTTLEAILREGELEARYYNRKPLLEPATILEWVKNLPTEKPAS